MPLPIASPSKKRTGHYRVIFLENEYVQLMILLEISGRIHAATDKTNKYDFLYRQHVIKPALVGLLGSGFSAMWSSIQQAAALTESCFEGLRVQFRLFVFSLPELPQNELAHETGRKMRKDTKINEKDTLGISCGNHQNLLIPFDLLGFLS